MTDELSDKENTPANTMTINTSDTTDLQSLWLMPYISHFTWLFQKQLNMSAITPVQLEAAILHANTDTNMCILLTRILLSRHDRSKLSKTEHWPYHILNSIIGITLDFWFDTTVVRTDADDSSKSDASSDGDDKAAPNNGEEYEIDEKEAMNEASYAAIVRKQYATNPLHGGSFDTLPAQLKARVIHTICDYYLYDTDAEFIQHIRTLEPSAARVEPIGQDGAQQYYFFGFNDHRVYRSTAPPLQHLQRTGSNMSASSHIVVEPTFELVTRNADELAALIKRLTKQTGKSTQLKDLISALEQVQQLCNEGQGHTGASATDKAVGNKKQKTMQPSRGSSRLEAVMLEQQQRAAVQQQLEEQKYARRRVEIDQRASEYEQELITYYQLLRKAIRKYDIT